MMDGNYFYCNAQSWPIIDMHSLWQEVKMYSFILLDIVPFFPILCRLEGQFKLSTVYIIKFCMTIYILGCILNIYYLTNRTRC